MLVNYFKASTVDYEKYLRICEQLGQEPDPERMPLEPQDFPEEVQLAFFMYYDLADRWDGASGAYFGKDWNNLNIVFNVYKVDTARERQELYFWLQQMDGIVIKIRADEAEQKRKTEERRAKRAGGGGKNYSHNIKG